MFACVYFERDATLSVVHQTDKDLSVQGTFEKGQTVEMRWRVAPSKTKETFSGVIIKVGSSEETLTKYATRAYNSMLKGVLPGTPAPETLFTFEGDVTTCGKRERIPTKKITESKEQDAQLGTPKKKKRKSNKDEKSATEKSATETGSSDSGQKTREIPPQPEPQNSSQPVKKTITSLFRQFTQSISDSSAENWEVSNLPSSAPQHEALPADHYGQATSFVAGPELASCSQTEVETSAGTDLSTTWQACHGALNLLGRDPSLEFSEVPATCSYSQDQLPAAASTSVIETLRGLISPEFRDFVQKMCEHIESNTCPHTCLKSVMGHNAMDLEKQDNISGGFMSELQTQNSSNLSQQTYQPVQMPLQHDMNYGQNFTTTNTADDTMTSHHDLPSKNGNRLTDPSETPRRSSPRKKNSFLPSPSTPDCSDQTSHHDLPSKNGNRLTDPSETPRRSSPRKKISFSPSPSTPDCSDQVKLLPTSQLTVNRQNLRLACHKATKKKDNAAFILMYGLLDQVFTVGELAACRGLGIGKARPKDASKPVLDKEKISVLKEYVNSWCKKNFGLTFPDKALNDAVTERSGYARRQLTKPKEK